MVTSAEADQRETRCSDMKQPQVAASSEWRQGSRTCGGRERNAPSATHSLVERLGLLEAPADPKSFPRLWPGAGRLDPVYGGEVFPKLALKLR